MKLNKAISLMKLARDDESLNIYIEDVEGINNNEPIHIVYWHIDEWLEDAETVVGAMLVAMELFYTDKEELLNRLGFVIELDSDREKVVVL